MIWQIWTKYLKGIGIFVKPNKNNNLPTNIANYSDLSRYFQICQIVCTVQTDILRGKFSSNLEFGISIIVAFSVIGVARQLCLMEKIGVPMEKHRLINPKVTANLLPCTVGIRNRAVMRDSKRSMVTL